jgi:hypothetical protein
MLEEANIRVNKMTLREKARLNIGMAKDLAENFGGKKADYLKKLNQRLRTQIVVDSPLYHKSYYVKAA